MAGPGPASTTTVPLAPPTAVAPETTVTTSPPPATTLPPVPITLAHISQTEALGALVQAFAQLLPGYRPTDEDVALFQDETRVGGDTILAAVGFVSKRYAQTIAYEADRAAAHETAHQSGCISQSLDEAMSGTTVVSHDTTCR